MDTFVTTELLGLAAGKPCEERRVGDGRIVTATAFAYRLALSQGRAERDAAEAARHAYVLAGGDLERADTAVGEVVMAESRTRPLWLKRSLRPRIVRDLLPREGVDIHRSR